MLCLVIDHGMMSFCYQTAQKDSALLRSSVSQFPRSMTSYHALYMAEQSILSYGSIASNLYDVPYATADFRFY